MKQLLPTAWCIFPVLLQCVVGCLHFEAIPSTINFGMTKEVKINCTFRYTESSAITNVTEISIVKSGSRVLNEMVTMKRPQSVIDTSVSSDLTADGFFDVNDLSTLTLRMKCPVAGDAGTYVCLVKGLDSTGHTHEAVESMSVTFRVSEEMCPRITKEEKMSFLFYPPLNQGGSTYYASKIPVSNSSMAEDFCSEMGGYLIEVDDQEELELVYQLSKQHNIRSTLIAGTDAVQEGRWVFPRTGNLVPVLNWDKNQPDNYQNNEDCRVLNFADRRDKLNDIACQSFFNFICEVNEAPEYVLVV